MANETEKEGELVEWDHMEMSSCGTSATLRTVRSTAPKGDYFKEQNIREMPIGEEEEMHRANALIDELDRYIKPTLKPGQLTTSLEDEEEEGETRTR